MIRKQKFLVYLFLAAVTGLGVSAGVKHQFANRGGRRDSLSAGKPLEVSGVIDLGTVVVGKLHEVPMTIRNPRSEPVTITDLHADCSCTEIYRILEGVKVRVKDLRLENHSSVTVFASLRTSGTSGIPAVSAVQFRDKMDPNGYYKMNIIYVPSEDLYTIPKVVSFGQVDAGGSSTQRVELRSNGKIRGGVELLSSNPSLITLQFTEATDQERSEFVLSQPGQTLVGSIDVALKAPADAANRNEGFLVQKDGLRRCEVPVTATAVSEYTLVPNRLVLPRFGSGRPVYEAKVICRSRQAKPVNIEPLAGDGTFQVVKEVSTDSPRGVSVYNIRYDGPAPDRQSKNFQLEFKVTDPRGERRITLPVKILRAVL